MVGQLRLKPHIDEWDGDDEVTFYAANATRPRELADFASSSSSSNSSNSDLSANADGQHGSSNRTNEALEQTQAVANDNQLPVAEDLKLHPFWRSVGKFYIKVPVSVVSLLAVTGISLLLGALAVKVIQPAPHWDKSLDAFEIPNHPSTLRREAFELAQKDSSIPNRQKRSIKDKPQDVFQWKSDIRLPNILDDGQLDTAPTNSIYQNYLKSKLFRSSAGGVDFPGDVFSGPLPSDHLMNINDHANDFATHAEEAEQVSRNVEKRSMSNPYRSRSQSWRIELVYMAKGPDPNIFTADRLKTIHKVEMDIMNHTDFTKFCARNSNLPPDPALAQYKYCLPPNSLMTYFFPSQVQNVVRYDGMGKELADINGTLKMAMNRPSFYWFVDTHMDSKSLSSKFIRSEVWFGVPIGDGPRSKSEYQQYKDFIVTYMKLLSQASTDEVDVLFGGTEIFDYEVSETIYHDILLSIPTFVAIFILLLVFTSFSFWLTFCGLLGIIFSFACAYFCYHVFFGIDALGLLNVASIFVIIGIGVDDVFVFVNTFRQADGVKDPAVRMGHTIKTAGVATFFTSITTAGAFGANMASQIPAIFDFGLFMMLLVVFCWLMVFAIMPPALNLWHRYLNCELYLMHQCKRQQSASPGRRSAGLYRVLAEYENQSPPAAEPVTNRMPVIPANHVLDDSDIPLLELEDEPELQGLLTDDEDDVPLIELTSVPAAPSSETKEAASLTAGLQKLLHRFVAVPVMKARWVIIVAFCIIFCVTIGLVSRLQPASRPPALYRPDTNLQRLLDLAYNFSGKDVSCKDCSGFQQEKEHPAPPIPNIPNIPTQWPFVPTHVPETTYWQFSDATRQVTKPHSGGGGAPTTTPRVEPGHVTNPTWVSPAPMTSATKTTTVKKITCKSIRLHCHFGAMCIDDPQPHCACNDTCNIGLKDIICGSDGKTYLNLCQMKQYSCIDQRPIRVSKKGMCEDPTVSPKHTPASLPPEPEPEPEVNPSSPGAGYNPCAKGGDECGDAASRPLLDTTAIVFLVFGIAGVDKSNVSTQHVLNLDKGTVMYDMDFIATRSSTLQALCKICKSLANDTELVKPGGAECFPKGFLPMLQTFGIMIPKECFDLPTPKLLAGQRSHIKVRKVQNEIIWFAMAFESKIYEGKSSFEAYKDYLAWEKKIQDIKANLSEEELIGLDSMFQTCDYWQQVFMEIIGVTSAIYGVAFSMIVCIIAVALFTAHITILMIAFLTIGGVILVVVSMFYLLGWHMGAVEAVSLSILVGSSIDYCIHLVEGYRVAGNLINLDSSKPASEIRRQRTIHSLSTIGVSILSSALTTVIAAIPLCFTTVQLFAKFGQIVALNTLVSIIYTLSACAAFLACLAPARYKWNLRGFAITVVIILVVMGAGVLGLYISHWMGVTIPGPSGNTLFG